MLLSFPVRTPNNLLASMNPLCNQDLAPQQSFERAPKPRNLQKELKRLPTVPAMARSLVWLELMLREPVVDLAAVCELIRADLGLTLHTLRLAGEELHGKPRRIEDCVIHLGKTPLLLSPAPIKHGAVANWEAFDELWKHARTVARWAEHLAFNLGGIDPEKAYLVGLLHDIGRLPELLNWPITADLSDRVGLGCAMAEAWQFPYFVQEGIRFGESHYPGASTMAKLVAAAHERAAVSKGGYE